MPMFSLPKTVIKMMDKGRRKFFWQGECEEKVPFGEVAKDMQVKEEGGGGLGIKNQRKMNLSLLCKWWWALECEEGL
jgi:hypothetical protein